MAIIGFSSTEIIIASGVRFPTLPQCSKWIQFGTACGQLGSYLIEK